MNKVFKNIIYMSVSTLLLVSSSMADDVTDTMEDALTAYNKGDYTQAKDDLSYVLELLKQKKGDEMKKHFPDALEGWTAEEATSNTAGAGMLGGGVTLSRKYTKDKSEVTIEFITDSPLLQSIGMMMSNPMFVTGGKLKRINREKAMIKYNEKQKSGEITLILDQRIMISAKGKKVDEETLVDYLKAMDFKKLAEN